MGGALSELWPERREARSRAGVRLHAGFTGEGFTGEICRRPRAEPPGATAAWTHSAGRSSVGQGWLLTPVPSPPQPTRRRGPQIPLLLRRWSGSRGSCEAAHGAGVGAGCPPGDRRRLRGPPGVAGAALHYSY